MGLTQSASDSTEATRPESTAGLMATAEARVEESDSYAEGVNTEFRRQMAASNGLMQRIIGGGFMLVIGIIMLGFLFDLDLVANFSGPFADQLSTVETVLGAAIVFAVLGILAMAGVYAYSMFQQV